MAAKSGLCMDVAGRGNTLVEELSRNILSLATVDHGVRPEISPGCSLA